MLSLNMPNLSSQIRKEDLEPTKLISISAISFIFQLSFIEDYPNFRHILDHLTLKLVNNQ